MSGSPKDSAPSERLAQRRRRAVGVGALALVVIAGAAFGYLHSTTSATTKQTAGLPSTNPPPGPVNSFFYSFVTPSLGWAVENPGGQFHVFRTKDGARHWQQQLAGKSSSPGFSGVGPCCRPPITVHVFDKTNGYMVVNLAFGDEHAYLTSDGGDRWHAVLLPVPQSVVVTFSDPRHGWDLATVNPLGQEPLFKLHATSDGGATWQPLADPPGDAFYLAVRGPTEAWLGSFGPGPPHVYSSGDAGRTWQRHDLPPPPGRTWGVNNSTTIVQLLPQFGAVASTEGAAFTEGGVFTTVDAGGSWRYVPPSPGDVGYQDTFHWWAIGGNALFKSSDAGQTWVLITESLPNWQFVGSPLVLDSKHAWSVTVAGGAGLALTNDGGLHWTRANVPHP